MSRVKNVIKKIKLLGLGVGTYVVGTGLALASTSGGGSMPWDGPLNAIYQNTHGPLATTLVGLATVVAGGIWMKGEHGKAMHTVLGVVAGAGVMIAGGNIIGDLGLAQSATIGSNMAVVGALLHSVGM
jgi:type IV secretion system protein VirB2